MKEQQFDALEKRSASTRKIGTPTSKGPRQPLYEIQKGQDRAEAENPAIVTNFHTAGGTLIYQSNSKFNLSDQQTLIYHLTEVQNDI